MATGSPSTLGNNVIQNMSQSSNDHCDTARTSCKLRRQHPIKRESSRRILVRPVVQRRREPSLSSSCESLDEWRSPIRPIPNEQVCFFFILFLFRIYKKPFINFLSSQSNISNQPSSYLPSPSLIASAINDLEKKQNNLTRASSNNDSLSDDSDINLYEMRVPIGKTYDTSDISVQLEGPKILIHCHTIEPTDKRGNYRKHEFKTELLVPDVVDDESIVAYLTEDGQLIVEGKYQPWAWEEIKRKRKIERHEATTSACSYARSTSPIVQSSTPQPPPPQVSVSSTNSTLSSSRTDGGRFIIKIDLTECFQN